MGEILYHLLKRTSFVVCAFIPRPLLLVLSARASSFVLIRSQSDWGYFSVKKYSASSLFHFT